MLKILFLDNHLLVVEKPVGLSTQAHSGESFCLEEKAKEWVKQKFHKPGRVFLTPVHRLDTPVSGLVLFARTSKSLSRLNESMRDKQIKKIYYARIEGHLDKKEGELEHLLIHGQHRAEISKNGKKARLSYLVLSETSHASFIEIHLHTGRYHQIRAQFSHIGHPICGDVKYGGKKRMQEGIDLHHMQLSFPHPISKKIITVKSDAHFA